MIRTFTVALAALALAACNGGKPANPVTGDATMGPADAKVTLTEFAAPTCPVCKGWHDQVFAKVKADYIDTGKIRFILRELPSHNPPVDVAIFAIARCAGPDKYFDVIDEAFVQQSTIDNASHSPTGPREELAKMAAKFNIKGAAFEACIKSPETLARIEAMRLEADSRNVRGTPSLFINDQAVPENDYSFEALAGHLDTALAGGAAPAAPAPAPTAEPTPAQ